MGESAKEVAPDTAARIREVALDLFSRRGYEKTSLREIAEALGITKAAVYYHYRSKVDILDDLLRPIADGEERILAEARESSLQTPAGQFRLIERYLDLVLEYRDLTMYIVSDVVGASNSRMVPRLQRHDQQLVTLLTQAELTEAQQVRTMCALGAVMTVLSLSDIPSDRLRPLLLESVRATLGLPAGS